MPERSASLRQIVVIRKPPYEKGASLAYNVRSFEPSSAHEPDDLQLGSTVGCTRVGE
jgi:hypothetical protein